MLNRVIQQTLHHSDEAGAAPAAPPAPAAPSEPSAPASPFGPVEIDFEALSKDYESDMIADIEVGTAPDADPAAPQPTDKPASAAPAGGEPAPGVGPPSSAAPASPPAPPAAAAPTPAPSAPPAQGAQPAQPAPPVSGEPQAWTPDRVEAAYKQFEADVMPQLVKQYTLTEEQMKELDENPSQLIPKLMARAHYSAQVAAYTGIMSQLPRIVGELLKQNSIIEKAERAFATRWPDLDKPEHKAAVDQGIMAWRQANPKATSEELIEKAGLMLMLSLGLAPNLPQQGHVPQTPHQPARPAGVGGAGPQRIPAGGASSIFEEMAEDYIAEDRQ